MSSIHLSRTTRATGKASVNRHHFAGDVGGVVGGEETDEGSDLLWLAEPAARTLFREGLFVKVLGHVGAEPIIKEAAANGEFTAVKVGESKAVIISEEEWRIMRDGLKLLFNGKI